MPNISSTGTGSTPHSRARPSARKFGSKTPSADSPLGKIIPVVIDRPALGISCKPVRRKFIARVASKSGMRSQMISAALSRPTPAPKASTIGTVATASSPQTTIA